MKIIISNHITIIEAPESLTRKLRNTFMLENPLWISNDKMCRWNGKTDHYIYFYKQTQTGFAVPRGALGLILYFCKGLNILFEIIDNTRTLPQVDFVFNGTLKKYQAKAVQNLLDRDFGVLQAPTGSGKTAMALSVIVQRRQPALAIVHTKELLNQWCDRIETFLGIPQKEIDVIGNGKKTIGEKITVGTVNSIYLSYRG